MSTWQRGFPCIFHLSRAPLEAPSPIPFFLAPDENHHAHVIWRSFFTINLTSALHVAQPTHTHAPACLGLVCLGQRRAPPGPRVRDRQAAALLSWATAWSRPPCWTIATAPGQCLLPGPPICRGTRHIVEQTHRGVPPGPAQ